MVCAPGRGEDAGGADRFGRAGASDSDYCRAGHADGLRGPGGAQPRRLYRSPAGAAAMIKLRRPQKLYWRPAEIPLGAMLVLAAAALAALIVVETFTHEHSSDYYSQMLSASRHVQQSIESLRPIRGRIEPIDPEVDPLRSGLIGLPTSSITSNSGSLDAKQATINPNWAAVVIRLLAERSEERRVGKGGGGRGATGVYAGKDAEDETRE